MNKVRATAERYEGVEGYVVDRLFKNGRWLYKLSISEDPRKPETYDNWIPEDCLERTK